MNTWPNTLTFINLSDWDGDLVAGEFDKCPRAKGALENEGCPDTDSDGKFDNTDECPDNPDPRAKDPGYDGKGCPVPGENELYFAFESATNGAHTIEVLAGTDVPLYWNVEVPHNREKYYTALWSSWENNTFPTDQSLRGQFTVKAPDSGSNTIELRVYAPGVYKTKSVTLKIKVVHGDWTTFTECSSGCGKGTKSHWCSNPYPSGAGAGCPKADGTEAKGGEQETVVCDAGIACEGRLVEDNGCMSDADYSSSTKCDGEREPALPNEYCANRNDRYGCVWDHWGGCGVRGMKTVGLLTCHTPKPENAVWGNFTQCSTPRHLERLEYECGSQTGRCSGGRKVHNEGRLCSETPPPSGCVSNDGNATCSKSCGDCRPLDCKLSGWRGCENPCTGSATRASAPISVKYTDGGNGGMQVYGPKNGGRSCEQVAVDTDGKGLSIACRDLHPACQTTVQDIGKKFSPRYSEGYLYPGISVTTLGGFAGSVRLVSEYGISYDLVRKKYENWDFDDSLGVCGYFIKNQNVAWEQYEFEGLWSHNKPWYRHTFDVAGINMSDNSNFTKPFGTIGVFGYSASEKRYVVYCMLITYQQLIGPDFERKKAVVSDLYPCQQGLCKVPGGP